MSTQDPQNAYGQQNPYGGQAAADPGDTIGKVGKILSIIPCTWFIGLILDIVAYNQSKSAGFQNKHTKIGFIFAAIWGGIAVISWIVRLSSGNA